MAFKKGEVLPVTYPYTDLTTTKARPAVVVSSEQYHLEQPDVILAALTTNVAAATGALDYQLEDWAAAGLRFPTAFKPVTATLEPALIVHRLGHLSARDLNEVQSRLYQVLDL